MYLSWTGVGEESSSRWRGRGRGRGRGSGEAAGARDQVAALLPVTEQALGAEDLDTLTARGNLAYWTGDAGDAVGAGATAAAEPKR